jgi:hypothetical protein
VTTVPTQERAVTTITGIPAHALLVHAIVVLAPLTALLSMLCAVWPAARRRFVWLALALAVVTVILTPLTTSAGEWLYNREPAPSEILVTHANRGQWMIAFALGLLVVAIALAILHRLESRSDKPRKGLAIAVAILAIIVGVWATVGVVLIGDAGAQAVWGRSG